MRLSDAGLRRRLTKLIYLNHRPLLGSPKLRPRSLEPIVRGRRPKNPSDQRNGDNKLSLVGYEQYWITVPNYRPDSRAE